jgi:hypothetical protein
MQLKISPLFIIGNPRSGTTLLRLMLTSHPNICIPPECGFAIWWFSKYKNWTKPFSKVQVQDFVRDLLESRKFETWKLSVNELTDFILANMPSTYAELVDSVYRLFCIKMKKPGAKWGDKNNFYLNHIDPLSEIFPGCYFVHIVRDGRDIACSYRKVKTIGSESKYAPKLPTEITAIAEEWHGNLNKIKRSFENLNWKNVIEIRYEDLVADPKKTLSRVCESFGEEYNPQMLEFYLLNRQKGFEPAEFLQWKELTLHPLSDERIGRFKIEMTVQDVRDFQRIAQSTLDKYKYE